MASGSGKSLALAAFLTTAALLSLIQLLVSEPVMLLADRYLPGAGWLEAFALSLYAAFVATRLSQPRASRVWRSRIWLLFSAVFFLQLLGGLAGAGRLLMTGELHLPVPALIAAGPLYRGHGFFMLTLFLVTLLLVGPAWCSYLCYIGAWDDRASRARKQAQALPRFRGAVRVGITIAVLLGAWLLGFLDVESGPAAWAAGGFGLAGVLVMLWWSRRTGCMVHCVTWCPMGLFADVLGKLSPFRIRFGTDCDECGACSRFCRYDALSEEDIRKRVPGLTCTLCGDCLAACPRDVLHYRLPGLGPEKSRMAFIVLVTSLHAVFLGVARL